MKRKGAQKQPEPHGDSNVNSCSLTRIHTHVDDDLNMLPMQASQQIHLYEPRHSPCLQHHQQQQKKKKKKKKKI